jgi:predicted RND superfamily exporter protein
VQSGAEAAGSAESGPGGDIEKGPLSPLLARILNDKANSALVTGHVADLDAEEITRLVADIDRSLGPARERYPGLDVTLTGLPVLSATMAIELMNQLKLGLVLAVVVIIGLIGVAFRSVKAMAFSVIPNLFMIAAAGAFMFAAGQGLQYSGIVALTVAFGLAADDTIHFLNRLQLEQTSHLEKAVTRTVTHVGPVLILTTLVLVLGLTVTGLSDLPPIRLFGKLCIITLVSALVGDLLLLPAIILSSKRLRRAR